MKRNTTIVLFASIFAVAIGTLGLSGTSASTLMLSGAPHSQEQAIGMLGHVEYMVQDNNGNIAAYMQGDNTVVNDGEDCAADAIFGDGTCITGDFNFIAIGNHTGTPTPTVLFDTNSTLADLLDDTTSTCASSSDGSTDYATDGEMARRGVTPTHTPATGTTGTIVELDTSGAPFSFDASNATTVYDSGIFNSDYATSNDQNTCAGVNTSGGNQEMFSRQQLNGATGITVNAGDSLSVKWTITVG